MMLKLVNLQLVNQIVCTRDVMLSKLRAVNAGDFVVTIGGLEREDDETKRLVKPMLKQRLHAGIAALEHELAEHGVDVLDGGGAPIR